MDRAPRNSKRDHLVNTKLNSFAYFQIGVIQASAGIYTYFLTLNDFGIRPSTVWGLATLKAPYPNLGDTYDAAQKVMTQFTQLLKLTQTESPLEQVISKPERHTTPCLVTPTTSVRQKFDQKRNSVPC